MNSPPTKTHTKPSQTIPIPTQKQLFEIQLIGEKLHNGFQQKFCIRLGTFYKLSKSLQNNVKALSNTNVLLFSRPLLTFSFDHLLRLSYSWFAPCCFWFIEQCLMFQALIALTIAICFISLWFWTNFCLTKV